MPDVHLNDFGTSWMVWVRMEATGWKFLPYPGGLLEQPDWLMQDLFRIRAASERVKETLKNRG